MALNDFAQAQSLHFRDKPSANQPRPPLTHFRVHLADDSKHDVLAATSADAGKHVEKRNPGVKITKIKQLRETS